MLFGFSRRSGCVLRMMMVMVVMMPVPAMPQVPYTPFQIMCQIDNDDADDQ